MDFQYLNPSNNESTSTINIERKILALTLLALAASLGVDERGIALEVPNLQEGRTNEMRLAAGLSINEIHKERTHELVHEILLLVDSHGILRNPTWDGVRLLLLLWPLTQGVQSPLERVVSLIYSSRHHNFSDCSLRPCMKQSSRKYALFAAL